MRHARGENPSSHKSSRPTGQVTRSWRRCDFRPQSGAKSVRMVGGEAEEDARQCERIWSEQARGQGAWMPPKKISMSWATSVSLGAVPVTGDT